MIDIRTAAAAAGVTVATIRRWVRTGRLAPADTRTLRFNRHDVERARLAAESARNVTLRTLLA